MYKKDFDKWNSLKKVLGSSLKHTSIRKGEIRWVILGVNVGSEMDGKGISFTRPALILHVIGKLLTLIIPLSTKIKKSTGYLTFNFKDKENSLCLHQIKIISQDRVLHRIGKISDSKLLDIKNEIKQFFDL